MDVDKYNNKHTSKTKYKKLEIFIKLKQSNYRLSHHSL